MQQAHAPSSPVTVDHPRVQNAEAPTISVALRDADPNELLQRVAIAHERPVIRKGRNVAAGYARGWGLQFSDLLHRLAGERDFAAALELTIGRSILTVPSLANLYLIMKHGLREIPGDIIEFGSYRGGSAMFMAKLLQMWGSPKKVFALDTFEGMPPTDQTIDLHISGDFHDTSVEDVVRARDDAGLGEHMVIVKGLFEDVLPDLCRGRSFSLVHVDCDIYPSIKYVLQEIHDHLSPGAYAAFDDPLVGSCLGAMEACEESYIQGRHLHAEQTYPHFIFRPKGP